MKNENLRPLSAIVLLATCILAPSLGGISCYGEEFPEMDLELLWERPLGEGYSGIAADAERLYTMYREGDDEIIVALRPENGLTLWEHRYQAKPDPFQTKAYGQGPNAAPLSYRDRIMTIGFTGLMHCLEAKTGKVLWSHDLVEEYGGIIQFYGYSNRPVAYEDTVIALVGSDDFGAVALKINDGTPVWKSKPFDTSYAPPVLINVDGQDQVVMFSPDEVIGIDAGKGSFLWSHSVVNR